MSALVAGAVKSPDQAWPASLVLHVDLPWFTYGSSAEHENVQDEQWLPVTITREVARRMRLDLNVDPGGAWDFQMPGEALLGTDATGLLRWLATAEWDDLSLVLPYAVSVDDAVVARGELEGLYFFDEGASVLGLVGSEAVDRPMMTHVPDRTEIGRRSPLIDPLVLNAKVYREVATKIGVPRGKGDGWLLPAIREMGVFTSTTHRLEQLNKDDLQLIGDRFGIASDALETIAGTWEELTTFPITVPETTEVAGGGTVTLTSADDADISREEFNRFRVNALVPVVTPSGKTEIVPLDVRMGDLPDPVKYPVSFTLVPRSTLWVESVAGPASVKVTGLDGSTVWSSTVSVHDTRFKELAVNLLVRKPEPAGKPADPKPAPLSAVSPDRLRGQVVAADANQKTAGLTVVVQAKVGDDGGWRPVAAGETAEGGYFSLPYPQGNFDAAQAFLSSMPAAVVDLRIQDPPPANEAISKDFIYLLLATRLPEGAGKEACCDDCAAKPERLPDQADLVGSGQFSQDLGGACVNLTTPNRTLREFSYNAIVRTEDPDVAEYQLLKRVVRRSRPTGGQWPEETQYYLSEPNLTLERDRISLTNPIRWQDAPAADAYLTLYQPVSVATGHILLFRSMFKADGYSLGDLVYSLPLAPGQKKHIVSYDVANALVASENQQVAQGERLAAELFDDRFITDQLGGDISEQVSGSSNAKTGGVSAGLGLGGSMGAISGTLGVAGGYAESSSRASQAGGRGISQYFGEKLRRSLVQNAESYRRLNASVVTAVKEGQQYSVETEVVANHNHCHSLTMMYFEVLRHYAVTQELVGAQECIFVPLQLTEFAIENVAKWKDLLAASLLPVPANTYLQPFLLLNFRRPRHPLLPAFDAAERIRTNYERVDFPDGRYCDEPTTSVEGDMTLRVNVPRPRTRLDRIVSLPVVLETTKREELDVAGTVKHNILVGLIPFAGPFLHGPQYTTVEEKHLAAGEIFDHFFELDANYRNVRPEQCVRSRGFRSFTLPVLGSPTFEFFQNDLDKERWTAYATVLGYADVYDLLEEHFKGRLVAEWDQIFYADIAPRVFRKIVNETLNFEPFGGSGNGLAIDATVTQDYGRGERRLSVRLRGGNQMPRATLAPSLRIRSTSAAVQGLQNYVTFTLERLNLDYATEHFRGPIFRGYVGDDLLDANGAVISIPLNANDERSPKKEDAYLAQELMDHLNSNIEHYNRVLWTNLDEGRRHMMLDGFGIETFDRTGIPLGMRSLASVVKNELITIVGNSMVFTVADGFHVNQGWMTAGEREEDLDPPEALFMHYKPVTPIPPYRLSVPTRGVYGEAVLGKCDSCEEVKENSSQDWQRFTTDEPTSINPVTVPTPQRTDWKAIWAQFATPLVQMQAAPDMPAPGAGLAGLGEALTKNDAFRDITGLAGTQDNVMKTYQSNQDNAKAFAEMAKTLAMQEHNSDNSRGIMDSLSRAREDGAISDDDYRELTRDHLSRQIDGGTREDSERQREERRTDGETRSLTNAAIDAAGEGRDITATRTGDASETETVHIAPATPGANPIAAIEYEVFLIPQPNKTSCWAASMAMLVGYERQVSITPQAIVDEASGNTGSAYSLNQSYGWDRLEMVRSHFQLDDIHGLALHQSPTPQQWASWLRQYGPLYVTVDGAPTHAIIVYGVSGDGTPSGTRVKIHNPWDTTATFDNDATEFHPPNQGHSSEMTVADLDTAFNGGQLDDLQFYERWRVLYSTPVSQRLAASSGGGGTAPTGAGGLRIPIRVRNRVLTEDTAIRYSGTLSGGAITTPIVFTFTDANLHRIPAPGLADGTYQLQVDAEHTRAAAGPVDWGMFVPAPATADRVWEVVRVEVTVAGGRVSAVTGANASLASGVVEVALTPIWMRSPHQSARTAGAPTIVFLHHTAGRSDMPGHFIDPQGGADQRRVSAHYVVGRGDQPTTSLPGIVVKLVNDHTHAAWHVAGRSRWHGVGDLNNCSIGIEVVDLNGSYTEEQYVAILDLLRSLKQEFSIDARNFIAHGDVQPHESPTMVGGVDIGGQLGNRLSDPGRHFDWPRLEDAGYGIKPAAGDTVFTAASPATAIYGGFWNAQPTRRLTSGNPTVADEIRTDLQSIGYSFVGTMGAGYGAGNGILQRAVQVFKERFFSGSRIEPDAFYSTAVDFETAQMIKRVVHAVTHP